eukprot:NODE_3911_length_391_cov_69.877193_g3472_i0.p1 GENE.NODE_3911_length_391_cov_69.877193_g3472_i0~~NODE_3911_length_391_cov_69.877193_g3472_i0.p1  ORF type:complete len:103 (-),score=14.69 NODE_3911_length_391_cov_69.877193_g3472_i0:82-366(-)
MGAVPVSPKPFWSVGASSVSTNAAAGCRASGMHRAAHIPRSTARRRQAMKVGGQSSPSVSVRANIEEDGQGHEEYQAYLRQMNSYFAGVDHVVL